MVREIEPVSHRDEFKEPPTIQNGYIYKKKSKEKYTYEYYQVWDEHSILYYLWAAICTSGNSHCDYIKNDRCFSYYYQLL